MHTNSVINEIIPGVQGLPCLHTPSQGKPCTPASLLIAPTDNELVVIAYRFHYDDLLGALGEKLGNVLFFI